MWNVYAYIYVYYSLNFFESTYLRISLFHVCPELYTLCFLVSCTLYLGPDCTLSLRSKRKVTGEKRLPKSCECLIYIREISRKPHFDDFLIFVILLHIALWYWNLVASQECKINLDIPWYLNLVSFFLEGTCSHCNT